jgi:hypothetical protein
MFFVVCSAVAALACGDIDRPLDQRGPKLIAQQEGPPVLLSLRCELNGSASTISCSPVAPSIPARVSASVIHGATATYAIFFPFNLMTDTVAHTWQFMAYVQNLLKQPIGTLKGTTTGVKVFVTDFHAITGNGAVSVGNADGSSNCTAPNQPYFRYNQIIAPSGYSQSKLWRFEVPNTVTAVSMSIVISADFPAEQNVALTPPDSIPAWVHSDSNLAKPTATSAGNFTKRIVKVRFRPDATRADRQLAIAFVNGTVVGGKRSVDGIGGYYLVQVADDGTGRGILTAAKRLSALAQIESAIFEVTLK